MPEDFDMTALRRELKSINFSKLLQARVESDVKNRFLSSYDTILRDIQATYSNWSYYAKKLTSFSEKSPDHTLNTARLIVPEDIHGPVILDATAMVDVIYELFDKVDVVDVPKDARLYGNLTYYVSRGHAVGKSSLVQNAAAEAPRLIKNMRAMLPDAPQRQALVICHQMVEPHIIGYKDASGFGTLDVGHWNALDGLNGWRNFDTVAILGLPYRDTVWSLNTFMALRGLQSQEWVGAKERPWGKYQDIRRSLVTQKIVAEVIQGTNWIACRKVIDSEGNCPKTVGFILIPDNAVGDAIVTGLRQEMPGVNILDWQYTSLKKRLRKSNHELSLIRFMKSADAGRYVAREVRSILSISPAQWERLAAQMKNHEANLHRELANIGVRYHVDGVGRGARSYLIKQEDR